MNYFYSSLTDLLNISFWTISQSSNCLNGQENLIHFPYRMFKRSSRHGCLFSTLNISIFKLGQLLFIEYFNMFIIEYFNIYVNIIIGLVIIDYLNIHVNIIVWFINDCIFK